MTYTQSQTRQQGKKCHYFSLLKFFCFGLRAKNKRQLSLVKLKSGKLKIETKKIVNCFKFTIMRLFLWQSLDKRNKRRLQKGTETKTKIKLFNLM